MNVSLFLGSQSPSLHASPTPTTCFSEFFLAKLSNFLFSSCDIQLHVLPLLRRVLWSQTPCVVLLLTSLAFTLSVSFLTLVASLCSWVYGTLPLILNFLFIPFIFLTAKLLRKVVESPDYFCLSYIPFLNLP